MERLVDPCNARDSLLASLGEQRGARYWSFLRSFLVAKLSKRELDSFLRETLSEDELRAHNDFFRAIFASASRSLPSVRRRTQPASANPFRGTWGSVRPALPGLLQASSQAVSGERGQVLSLTKNAMRFKSGSGLMRLPTVSRGRVRSCAFMPHPSRAQLLALRRRVLSAVPSDTSMLRDVSEECLLMLTQAVHCHVRSLLSAAVLAVPKPQHAGASRARAQPQAQPPQPTRQPSGPLIAAPAAAPTPTGRAAGAAPAAAPAQPMVAAAAPAEWPVVKAEEEGTARKPSAAAPAAATGAAAPATDAKDPAPSAAAPKPGAAGSQSTAVPAGAPASAAAASTSAGGGSPAPTSSAPPAPRPTSKRRLTTADLYAAVSLSQRPSAAAPWQLRVVQSVVHSRWSTNNIELVRAPQPPHLHSAFTRGVPPWALSLPPNGGTAFTNGLKFQRVPPLMNRFVEAEESEMSSESGELEDDAMAEAREGEWLRMI